MTTEKIVDKNLKQLLGTRFRLGLFDPVGTNPFDKIGTEVIRSEAHIALSREAAVKSIVLMKNKNNVLPLKKDIGGIYVCGPTAADMQALLANYYGMGDNMVTILEGIVGKVSDHTAIRYVQSALMDRPNVNPVDWFSEEAVEADVTIACMGITQLMEGEEGEAIASATFGDREDIRLPQSQIDFLKKIRGKAKKLVLVITAGSAVAIPEILEMADAVVYVWYPGEQGGQAVADILFGDESPSGRLPVTFVRSQEDLPPFEDYNMKNRTYRYMSVEPLLPFGFGLSYTQFEYANLKLSKDKVKKGKSITATLSVKNIGKKASDEVVQFYIKDMESTVATPNFSLSGFQRINLAAGESKEITFEITPKMMELVNEKGVRYLEKGNFKILIGGSLPTQRSLDLGASKWVEAIFNVK